MCLLYGEKEVRLIAVQKIKGNSKKSHIFTL